MQATLSKVAHWLAKVKIIKIGVLNLMRIVG